MPLKIPILFLTFNRPSTTARVFHEIAQIKPEKLFIACDGPRDNHKQDSISIANVKKIILEIPWHCEVKTLFRDTHLGCKLAVSNAINWFFENVEEGIILEDDCLPNKSFFNFCQELLHYYKNDKNIMHIGGTNFQIGQIKKTDSYYFSRYNHVWGWATWKRAWKYYDIEMKTWPETLKNNWPLWGIKKDEADYWEKRFQEVFSEKINTWDYQWTYACWKNHGLSIIPEKNLVANIGFGSKSAHTKNKRDPAANLSTQEIIFPLRHPLKKEVDATADNYTYKTHFNPNLYQKIKRIFKRY